MNAQYTPSFLRSYKDVSDDVKKALKKQVRFLVQNIRHPSLHAKKYDEAKNIWQARVDRIWRFYFSVEGDTYYLLDITSHPK